MAEAEAATVAADGASAQTLIEALRARGAARFDAVGFRFLDALAVRLAGLDGAARQRLESRLAEAAAALGERMDAAAREAEACCAAAAARFPAAAAALAEDLAAGDFTALRRRIAALEAGPAPGPLGELVARLQRPAADAPEAATEPGGAPAELRSLRRFRRTWSRLSTEQQLAEAFAQAPENAGPLNAHFLVLRALTRMRDLAPAYLEQFVSYANTLLWLEQVEAGRAAAQKPGARAERGRKRKPAAGGAS